jgi:hypothetical protein
LAAVWDGSSLVFKVFWGRTHETFKLSQPAIGVYAGRVVGVGPGSY